MQTRNGDGVFEVAALLLIEVESAKTDTMLLWSHFVQADVTFSQFPGSDKAAPISTSVPQGR